MSASLQNQTALVVGASSGIGRATAVLLARESVRVMAAARREDRLRSLQTELAEAGYSIDSCAVDVSRPESIERMAAIARERFGKIDILVYATGANDPGRSLRRLTPAIWDKILQVNLTGAYHATQAVLPQMRAAGAGHLVYIAS